jgi:hypothetical protein
MIFFNWNTLTTLNFFVEGLPVLYISTFGFPVWEPAIVQSANQNAAFQEPVLYEPVLLEPVLSEPVRLCGWPFAGS